MKIEDYRKDAKKMQSVAKRKLGIKKGEEVKTGDMISRMNEKKRAAIMGLV